eukprot:482414-Rhodomonas_salina.1
MLLPGGGPAAADAAGTPRNQTPFPYSLYRGRRGLHLISPCTCPAMPGTDAHACAGHVLRVRRRGTGWSSGASERA